MDKQTITKAFEAHFGTPALVVRAPGRVNLIGEHTDYNNGFVLPAPIDKQIVLAVAKNNSNQCRAYSSDFEQQEIFAINEGSLAPSKYGWTDYIKGVIEQIQKAGHQVEGFDIAFGGDIPVGSGLSSSAALECGTGFALSELFGLGLSRLAITQMAQKAENEFVGVKCGIMDQFANMFGKPGHVIKLDCRALTHEYFPFEMEGYKIVLFDTQVKHSLASSAYNERREECEAGVKRIQAHHTTVQSLRDCNLDMVNSILNDAPGNIQKRCRYIVEEIARVTAACENLKAGDLQAFGQKMYATHHGLQHDFEVSCDELDVLVTIAKQHESVLGARMMGGGFGGCTINLVKAEKAEQVAKAVISEYHNQLGKEAKTYFTKITGGTELI